MRLTFRIAGVVLAFAGGILAWQVKGSALGWLAVAVLVSAAIATVLAGGLMTRAAGATDSRDAVKEGAL